MSKKATSKHSKMASPTKKASKLPFKQFKNAVQNNALLCLKHSVAKKPKGNRMYFHVIVKHLKGEGASVECKHCREYSKPYLQHVNLTKGGKHYVPSVMELMKVLSSSW